MQEATLVDIFFLFYKGVNYKVEYVIILIEFFVTKMQKSLILFEFEFSFLPTKSPKCTQFGIKSTTQFVILIC